MEGRRLLQAAASTGVLALVACDVRVTHPSRSRDHGLPPGVVTELLLPTYDRSGQTVHPDFAASPDWWGQGDRYLAVTPYPGGDSRLENPSLFVGESDASWSVHDDAPNPVAFPPSGYYSDPDIVFEPGARELWMYFRQVDAGNVIWLMRSGDGIHWGGSTPVLTSPNHSIVSPSVVRLPDGRWMMWSINAGAVGCNAPQTAVEMRRSSDGIHWSTPVATDLAGRLTNLWPWHIDVQWIPSRREFWALYNAKDARQCGTTALFFATSPDGLAWTTRPRPVLVAGQVPAFESIVYRSTFRLDAAARTMTIWYSGARPGNDGFVWTSAVESMSENEFMARLSDGTAAAALIPPSVRLASPP